MRTTPDANEFSASLQFTVEDDFSYFCRYDDLMGVVASPDTELPAIEDSCYINRSEVFLPPRA